MKLAVPKLSSLRLAVVMLGDRLGVAAIQRDRVETFTIDAENPGAALRAELDARALRARTVAIGLMRSAVTVKPIELPAVAGGPQDMVRFELERHLPIPADDAAFDFGALPADADVEGPSAGKGARIGEPRGALELAVATASNRHIRSLDLIPSAIKPRRFTRQELRTAGALVATVLLALAALLVPGFVESRRLARLNGEIARIDPDVRAVERVARELDQKRQLLDTVQKINTSALQPLAVLRELTEILPSDAWVTYLALDAKGVEMTGQAGAASNLIPLFENSPRPPAARPPAAPSVRQPRGNEPPQVETPGRQGLPAPQPGAPRQ